MIDAVFPTGVSQTPHEVKLICVVLFEVWKLRVQCANLKKAG